MKKDVDVLVVGAGPVGLTMAAELARYGITVRIVEKAPRATDKSKALALWSRTLELMDRMGCTRSFVDAGFKVTVANITSGKETIASLCLDKVESPYPFGLMLPQADTERLLAQHSNSLGVAVERNLELMDFSDVGNGVRSTLRGADGKEESVESSWLVGCDGAHSTVRHRLGMEFQGDTIASDWLLADVHLKDVPNPGEASIVWHSEGVLVILPITTDRYRLIADVEPMPSQAQRPDPTLEEIQIIMDRRGPGGMKAFNPIWLASFRINERKVADYRSGRVFLVGDAAHVHSPAGGQGMNTGMQDACNLAWKLALVRQGKCKESPLLDSYSTERSAVGDEVLKGAGRITLIATMRGGVKQAIRNHVASLIFGFAPVQHAMANALTELSIGYPESPLTVQGYKIDGVPQAGQRAPIRKNELPIGGGKEPRFAIFAERDGGADELLRRYPNLLEQNVRAPFEKGGLWLVRPDGYVAVATSQGDWGMISDYLKILSVE